MLKLIGVYDYTVILTYLGLLSAVFGMTQASQGNFITAIFCLAFSGLCDTFDGRVARTKKDRTEDEKSFGVQLDSLCDVICFGVFPAMLCYHMGVNGPFGIAVVFFFCLCAVIRLAFFNVLEINHGKEEGEGGKGYRGLPVTSIGIILPTLFWLHLLLSEAAFVAMLHGILLLVGFLFILDFKMPKPGLKHILALMALGFAIVGAILLAAYC